MALDKGVLIQLTDGDVRPPFEGTVLALSPTKHAIGVVSKQGVEVLIHIGMNSIQLEGEYSDIIQMKNKLKEEFYRGI